MKITNNIKKLNIFLLIGLIIFNIFGCVNKTTYILYTPKNMLFLINTIENNNYNKIYHDNSIIKWDDKDKFITKNDYWVLTYDDKNNLYIVGCNKDTNIYTYKDNINNSFFKFTDTFKVEGIPKDTSIILNYSIIDDEKGILKKDYKLAKFIMAENLYVTENSENKG